METTYANGIARPIGMMYLFFFLSGIAALLYQVIWTKKLALLFGVSTYAISTTLSIFMLGLALGSWYFGALADRTKRPLYCYCLLELGIAVSAAVSLLLLGLLNVLVGSLGFSSADSMKFVAVRFVGAALILIVPTFLMGGTLPVLAKYCIATAGAAGRKIGALYAVNTFGGMAGCLLAGFVAIPVLGLRDTLLSGVVINLIVAVLAYNLNKRTEAEIPAPADAGDTAAPSNESGSVGERETGGQAVAPVVRRAMLAAFFISGFVGLAAEVAWTRMMLLSVDSTAQAFAGMLAVFLFGLAVGSAVAGRISDRWDAARGYGISQIIVGASIAVGIIMWMGACSESLPIVLTIMGWVPEILGPNTIFKISQCLILALSLLFVPTVLMGFAFPFAGRFFTNELGSLGSTLGSAYMLNTLGAMAGPLVGGFWCLPHIGIQKTLILCAAGSIGGGMAVLAARSEKCRTWTAATVACVIVLIAGGMLLPEKVLRVSYNRRDGKLLYYEEDVGGSIAVLEHRTPLETYRQLAVGMTSMISDSFDCRRYTRLIGHLPMLMHPKPERTLVICLGSGMTLSAVATHPDVQSVDCVDLSEGVMHAARRFFTQANGGVLERPNIHMIVNDGRTHLVATGNRYDVIVLEPPPPNAAGVSNLYSREFYELCRARLTSSGMIVQWLPYHSVTFEQARSVVATVQTVFPTTTVWSLFDGQEFCVIGHMSAAPVPYERIAARMATSAVKAHLTGVGIDSPEHLLSCFIMVPKKAQEFSEAAAIITDDLPGLGYDIVAYEQINHNSPIFWRDLQMWNLETCKFSEDPAEYFTFKDEQAKKEFAERYKPVKRAWEMHNRAIQIWDIAPLTSQISVALDKEFVPPIELEPENAYYKYSNQHGTYSTAMLRLADYFRREGNATLAKAYAKHAAKLPTPK